MATALSSDAPLERSWPAEETSRRVVFLLDACTAIERRLLRDWIDANRPAGATCSLATLAPSRPRWFLRARRRPDPKLEAALASADDPILAPLRVAWLPEMRDGVRAARFYDVATFGDPRDPDRARQWWLARFRPDRAKVVVAEPASVSALRARWTAAAGATTETAGFAEFVARQAGLANERAERTLRGSRYKVPRFVNEEITSRPAFRSGVQKISAGLGKPAAGVFREAQKYLREIAATHSPYVIDLVHRAIRLAYTQGYGEAIHYDKAELAKVYGLAARHPLVFLPTHKSNLDHAVMQYLLHENGHPPNHTAGGINMNFFPVGPLFRRTGVFFIRRTFKDNPTYKFVLRQYVDYLVEKRFPLEWYMEGGRSRSGKLLPPRLGLLAYVVDAWRRGKSEDVFLIPVSIAYDQINDVGDYVAEQRGAKKEKESIGWFVKMLRGLRKRYGDIHINFGEPVSIAKALGSGSADMAEPGDVDSGDLGIKKLAFEVAVRINRTTPITPTSLVALALLGAGDRAMTLDEIVTALRNLLDYVKKRGLPTTGPLGLDEPASVKCVVDALAENGVVKVFAEGPQAVYAIADDQHIAAGYYRNTIIHFFVTGAIAEIALLAAAESPDALSAVDKMAMRLRDLLKFEFFFPDKDSFRRELHEEIAFHDPKWQEIVASGDSEAIHALVRRFRPFSAHRALRPFLEAYLVVGDALAAHDPATKVEEAPFIAACLALAKQYRLQRRIRSAESVSKILFGTAFQLAKHRGLLAPAADIAERRKAFAEEITAAVRRVDAVSALAASRRAGLIA